MKSVFTNFFYLLKRFTTVTVINIAGLTAALTVFFVVLMQAHYDLTFDRGYATAKNLYQLNQFDGNEGVAGTHLNFQIPAKVKSSVPETESYCMVANWGEKKVDIDLKEEGKALYDIKIIRTQPTFWEVFAPEIIMGDTTSIFAVPGRAMISEKTAERVFGNENPIGKRIRLHYENESLDVQAVYRDFPENSSLGNGLFTHLPEYEASEWSFSAYFLINPEHISSTVSKMNSVEVLGEEHVKYLEEHPEADWELRLTTPNQLYLTNPGKGGSKRNDTTYTLLLIGILTLAVAFVNFVNLSLAMAPARVKGICLRKILGINKTGLGITIAMESVLYVFIALSIAFGALHYLRQSALAEQMFAGDLSLWEHAPLIGAVSCAVLLAAFLVGLYAMRYTTTFDETEVLKGSFVMGTKGAKFRDIMIVFQFATAIALICISFLIKRQNDYMLNYDWGLPKENIVYLPLSGIAGGNAEAFGQEIFRDPRVTDYCLTRALPGMVGMNWGREFEGKQISLRVWSVDDRFFDFFDVDIIAGRKPVHMDSVVSQIVVNEAFLKKYEFDESLVGKDFPAFGPGRVQAVAKDVNFETLHEPVTPMAFGVLSKWQNFSYFLIKLSGTGIRETIDGIEHTWEKFSDEPFEINFLDESMDRLYRHETNMAKLIAIFGSIIVVIAIMGVYGLIVFNTRNKEKEIAIRKVNGASVMEILLMLNRTTLISFGVAFVIALPVAYYVMQKWLENFAYKTNVSWWIFLSGGMIVLAITLVTVNIRSWRASVKNPVDALTNE